MITPSITLNFMAMTGNTGHASMKTGLKNHTRLTAGFDGYGEPRQYEKWSLPLWNIKPVWKLNLLAVWKLTLIDTIKHISDGQWKVTPVWRLDFMTMKDRNSFGGWIFDSWRLALIETIKHADVHASVECRVTIMVVPEWKPGPVLPDCLIKIVPCEYGFFATNDKWRRRRTVETICHANMIIVLFRS